MESLGKELDLDGKVVHQGIAVYGNKGSTDQHAYIQQLRDGLDNFFATIVVVDKERDGDPMFVEDRVTSGDFLAGFYLGTRQALYEKGRESITLTLKEVSPFSVGVLIALFERAVGFYGSLVNVNAYHQPGVEAGKKAAATVIALQLKVLDALQKSGGGDVNEIAKKAGSDDVETVLEICERLSANPARGVKRIVKGDSITYSLVL
jgi:glucose-6-phosphate isomerase